MNTKGRPRRFYYRCPNRAGNGPEACPNGKNHRAETTEAEVWEKVSSLLKEPERLRTGIESYIKQEHRGDPEREMRAWAKRLADVDAKRSRYQDMAAEGLIDFDELRAKLDALETDRKTAARELEAVRHKAERLASLKLKTETLIEAYSRKARLGLDLYTPQDRFDAYKALGEKHIAHPDGTRELFVGVLRLSSGCPVVTQKVQKYGLNQSLSSNLGSSSTATLRINYGSRALHRKEARRGSLRQGF